MNYIFPAPRALSLHCIIKLQSYKLLNNSFEQATEYKEFSWILVNLSCQLLNISEKEQAIIKYFQKQPPEEFYKKAVLKNFAKFIGKHLSQILSFNKVAGPRPSTLLKKRLWHRCFPVNFVKSSRVPYLENTPGRLLLYIFQYLSEKR